MFLFIIQKSSGFDPLASSQSTSQSTSQGTSQGTSSQGTSQGTAQGTSSHGDDDSEVVDDPPPVDAPVDETPGSPRIQRLQETVRIVNKHVYL